MENHQCLHNCDCGWSTDRSTVKRTSGSKQRNDRTQPAADGINASMDGQPKKDLTSEYKNTLPGLRYLVDVDTTYRDDTFAAQDRVERHMLECLMKGDWDELWKGLQIYYHSRACHAMEEQRPKWWEIWQVGSEALSKTPGKTSFDRTVFFREVSKYGACSKNHVSAEEILHLIAEDRIEEAIEVSAKLIPPRGHQTLPHQCSVDDAWKLRRTALTGMLSYIKWLREEEDSKEGISESTDDEGTSKKDKFALQAVRHFESVVNSPGVWDIFVTKLAELYQYLGQDQSAKQALRTYWLKNPENPNAPKYLYNFLKSSKAPSTEVLEVLQDIAKKQPSDGLVVQFIQMLFAEFPEDPRANLSDSLRVVFSLLDYPSSAKELPAWELFNRIVKSILRSEEKQDVNTLIEEWESRKAWWPSMYFSHKNVSSLMKNTPDLITARSVSAVYLEGSECKFVTKVENWLTKNESSKLLRKIRKAKGVCPLEVKGQT